MAAKLLLLLAASSTAVGGYAVQSDWSGGPGTYGPVPSWGSCFHACSGLDWLQFPGALALENSLVWQMVGIGPQVSKLTVFDMDGDGDGDLLVPRFGSLELWSNLDGGSSWSMSSLVESYPGSAPYPSDLDSDGDIDLLCSTGLASILRADYRVSGGWQTDTVWSSEQHALFIEITDMDADDDLDAALIGPDSLPFWLENPGTMGDDWPQHGIDVAWADGKRLLGFDWEGDGDTDLVVARDSVIVLLERIGYASWQEMEVMECGTWDRPLLGIEVDGTPPLELVVGVSSSRPSDEIYLAGWTGGEWEVILLGYADFLPMGWQGLVGCDMNGDGGQDVVAHTVDEAFYWENPGEVGPVWAKHTIAEERMRPMGAGQIDCQGGADPILSGPGSGGCYWPDRQLQFVDQGTLLSSVLEVEDQPEWGWFVWDAEVPPMCSMSFRVRASDDPDFMGVWSEPFGSPRPLSGLIPDSASYFQYRLDMETSTTICSPHLNEVSVGWNEQGVSEHGAESLEILAISPNPCRDRVRVRLAAPEGSPVELRLYSADGRLVGRLKTEAGYGCGQMSMDLAGLPAGVYSLLAVGTGRSDSRRLVVLRP